MSYIVYKKFGKGEYAYEVTSTYEKKTKEVKKKTKYLGIVVDKKNKIYEKRQQHLRPEKLILDFGDSYLIKKFLENTKFIPLLTETFGENADSFLALMTYRLCHTGAMMHANDWHQGNYAKFQYPKADLRSQSISTFLKAIGGDVLQRRFFREYMTQFCNTKNGIIIDATSMPNQIHIPLTNWGRSGEEIDKQIRFLLVVDKESGLPVYFRTLPGNIVDVSTVENTMDELKQYGVKNTFVYCDAGFFSEDNIKLFFEKKIQFLTRLPAGRILYKELINTEVNNLESKGNIVKYGDRGLFVKHKKINLFGDNAHAYIVLDPCRKGRELSRLIAEIDSKNPTTDLEYEMLTRGIMILVSSSEISKEDVVPAYYLRQTAEVLFGFSKDDIGILPLRVHSEETLSGFLFLQFITLIAFAQMKKVLEKDYVVEEVLLNFRNLKCKIYDKEIVVSELTRKQKEIGAKLKVMVPKSLGI